MSASSSPNPARPPGRHRTIRATFLTTVVAPVASMLVIWGLLVAGVLGGAIGGSGASGQGHRDLAGTFLVAGTALVVILVSVVLMGLFTRRIAADVGGLEATTEHLAAEEMPQLTEKLRRGEPVRARQAQPATRAATAEVAQAEAAIARLARSAAAAAAAEARLRNGIRQVFVSLARRNQSLLHRQLRLIDALEQKASDPDTLADLFPLDHLTTRMRRHAEGLIILSGVAPGRSWSEPVPVIDVIRGAVAEIEDYKRVSVLTRSADAVAGQAVADLVHLVAELIENATLFSPSSTRVEVRAGRVANGFAIEVDDRGLGIGARQLATINAQLANPPDFDLANADQLGLFVVGKLAARHGVQVGLRPSAYGGTTAVVLMPANLVVSPNVAGAAAPDLRQAPDRGRHELAPSAAGPEPGTAAPDADFSLGPPGPGPGFGGPGSLSTRSTDSPRPASAGSGAAEPAAAILAAPAAAPPPSGSADAGTADAEGQAALPDQGATAAGAPDPAAAGPQPGAGTHRGLPRRVRQASLDPHLRQPRPGPDREAPAVRPAPAAGRSPEEARMLVSSLQRGWQRGRAAEPAATQPTASTDAAAADEPDARQDADAPQAGEA